MAKNAHSQTLAHVGLIEREDFKGLLEIGNLVTKSYARGQHLAQKIVEFVFETEAQKAEQNGMYIVSFGAHEITQKIAGKLDFTPCAIYFQNVPPQSCGAYRQGQNRLDGIYAIKLFGAQKSALFM